MALTYIASASGTNDASGTTLDCSSTLHVEIDDFLVCVVSNMVGDSTHAVSSTVPNNIFTMLTRGTNTDVALTLGYCVVSTHDAAATFRATYGTARTYRNFIVLQFRPDAGETVALDGDQGLATGSSATPQSGNINTVAGDEVIVCAEAANGSSGRWDQLIAEASPTATATSGNACYIGYLLTANAQTGIHGQLGHDSQRWVCTVAGFKSVSGSTDVAISVGKEDGNIVQKAPTVSAVQSLFTPHKHVKMIFG